jgi:hypothetical protein
MKKWISAINVSVILRHSLNSSYGVLRCGSEYVSHGLHTATNSLSSGKGSPRRFRHACRNASKYRHRYVVFPELSIQRGLPFEGAHYTHPATKAAARAALTGLQQRSSALPIRFLLAPDTRPTSHDRIEASWPAVAVQDLRPLLAGESGCIRWGKLLSESPSLGSLQSHLRQVPADIPVSAILPAAFYRLNELLSRHLLSTYRSVPMNVTNAVPHVEILRILQGMPTHSSGTHLAVLTARQVAEDGLFRHLCAPGVLHGLSMQDLVQVAECCVALQLPGSHFASKTIWKHLSSSLVNGAFENADAGAQQRSAC